MSTDSEQRGVHDTVTASKLSAHDQFEAKLAEIKRLQEQLNKVQAEEDDEDALLLALSQPVGTTDPLSCLCCCKFRRLGQSYILHERRVGSAEGGFVKTKLLIVGPHWIGVLVTLVIILLTTAMFLSQHINTMAWYNTLITFGLCAVTLYYLFQTTLTDPGIIQTQRQKDKTNIEDNCVILELENGRCSPSTELFLNEASGPRGRLSCRRYCDICGIEQEPLTDHCDDCGVCIAGYDHHCPWMGKCIGRDNIHAFRMFNVAWIIYVCFVLVIAITSIDWGQNAIESLKRTTTGEWVPFKSP
ncbi:putative palmitoyltransferase, DHHC domain-containing protein [Plasmopara halstedii]